MHINQRTSTGSVIKKVNYLIDLMNALLGNTIPFAVSTITTNTLDMSGATGSVAIVEISNNSGIDTISNAGNFDYIIVRAASGFTPYLIDRVVGGVGANANIKLGNPNAYLGSNKGFVALQRRTDGYYYQVNFLDNYNS